MSEIQFTDVQKLGNGTHITFTVDQKPHEIFLGRSFETTSKMTTEELSRLLRLKLDQRARYGAVPPSTIANAANLIWALSITWRREDGESPPRLAEFLFSWLAPKKTLHQQLGDLQEIYESNVTRFGKSRAGMLYWTQVLRAVGPGIRRVVKKLGLLGILIDYGRSKIGW